MVRSNYINSINKNKIRQRKRVCKKLSSSKKVPSINEYKIRNHRSKKKINCNNLENINEI
jgi:hypothetical protein